MKGQKVEVGQIWKAKLDDGNDGLYCFRIMAVVKQDRKMYVLATKEDHSDEAFDANRGGSLLFDCGSTAWFGSDGLQIDPIADEWQLLSLYSY